MSGSKEVQHLWWPKFELLYEGLREYSVSASSEADKNVSRLLQESHFWLQRGLQGFQPAAEAARSFLDKESHITLASGKKFPIRAELRAAAIILSSYLVQ